MEKDDKYILNFDKKEEESCGCNEEHCGEGCDCGGEGDVSLDEIMHMQMINNMMLSAMMQVLMEKGVITDAELNAAARKIQQQAMEEAGN
jgi:hypothetical protein